MEKTEKETTQTNILQQIMIRTVIEIEGCVKKAKQKGALQVGYPGGPPGGVEFLFKHPPPHTHTLKSRRT